MGGTSFCLLVSEVTLVRVLSFYLFPEVVTLAVAIPLLGLGAAGSVYSALRNRGLEGHRRRLCVWVLATCISGALFFRLAPYMPVDLSRLTQGSEIAVFAIFLLMLAIPFFFGGMILCELLAERAQFVAQRYAADLVAAALGACAAVLLIGPFGAPRLLLAAHGLVALCAIPIARKAGSLFSVFVIGAGCVVAMSVATLFVVGDPDLPLPWKIGGRLPRGVKPIEHHWTPYCRIDLLDELELHPIFGGGMAPKYSGIRVKMMGITQDATAPTALIRLKGGNLDQARWTRHMLQALPYYVIRPDQVAVVGAGGGPDVLAALVAGARHVTAIEINPVIVGMLEDSYADYTGHLAQRPDVSLVCVDGRSYLATTDRSFDVIQLSGVDTFTSGTLCSLAMTENYLYTVEAMDVMYERLEEGGVLSYSRWFHQPPREILRIVSTMLEMLERRGISAPENRFLVVAQTSRGSWADVLLKRGEFTKEEINRSLAWTKQEGLYPVHVPGHFTMPGLKELFSAGRETFIANYSFDIRASTDDHPFFFNFYTLGHLFSFGMTRTGLPSGFEMQYPGQAGPLAWIIMLVTLGVLGFFGLLFVFGPLFILAKHPVRLGRHWPLLFYAGALGLGFILFELTAVHHVRLLLGSGMTAFAVMLAVLLFSAGVGAWYSGRKPVSGPRLRLALVSAGACFLVYTAIYYTPIVGALEGSGLFVRLLVVGLTLMPTGFFLGIPLPTVLRALGGQSGTVAWAWAVNAFATVIATTLAGMLAQWTGYWLVLSSAGLCYLAAFLLAKRVISGQSHETS